MTDAVLRKFVKPSLQGASIPDPAHGRDLPQEGMEVVWDHYWIGREQSGDVIVSDIKAEGVAGPAEKPVDAPKAAETSKSVKG